MTNSDVAESALTVTSAECSGWAVDARTWETRVVSVAVADRLEQVSF